MSIIFQGFSKDLIKGSRFKTNDIWWTSEC